MKKGMSWLLALVLVLGGATFAAAQEELTTVQVAYMITMNPAEERDMVQDAINELLAEKDLGIQVELVCIDFASWNTQINLLLTDGGVDLFNSAWVSSLSVLADNGSIAPIDGLLAEYGQGIVDTLGDYLACAEVDGQIYGAPKVDAYSSAPMFMMRKDLADEAGIDPEAVTDLASLTEALKLAREKFPDMTIISTGSNGDYFSSYDTDTLGTEDPLGVLMLSPDSGDLTVINYYESDQFTEHLAYAAQWSELGFFRKDPLNIQDGSLSFIADGEAFGGFAYYCSEDACIAVQENNLGYEIYACQLADTPWARTGNVNGMTWCIPALSQNQEGAMIFLNELFINAELSNLVCSGIEGVHYVQTGEGNITYAEGLDAMTTGWPSGMGTFWPNLLITEPWAPSPAGIYDEWLASNETCGKSPALGFAFNAAPVADEISACANVVDKYYSAMMLHIGDTEQMHADFLSELESAGIGDIIAEKQAQLDAWAAAQ